MRQLLALFFAILATAASAAPPNVVMIISDDQAWTDYGFMGNANVRTPHLDRLAAQSLVFPRGYVTSSLCCPSLAAMITGRYPQDNKITSNDPPLPPGIKGRRMAEAPEFREGRARLARAMEEAATIPRLLAAQGYLSFQTGKWWQGHFSTGGFTHGMSLGDERNGGRHGDAGLTIGRATMQPIFDFIAEARQAQKPFFVWYAPMLPHDPHNAPERLQAPYRDKAPDEATARYWANIEWFDETCGALLEHLRTQGLSENTLVVYLADNGWIPGGAVNRFDPRSKQSQYDGGLRTPIIVHWPGKVQPQRREHLASAIDLLPTILAATGGKTPPGLPGIDLLNETAVAARRAIYGACFTHNAIDLDRPAANLRWRWMIDRWTKLIVPAAQNEPDAALELYDLRADPAETRNLASSDPSAAAALRTELDRWWKGD